jgi:hypothetical protein
MADSIFPLSELHNQRRPARRNDKTYGKRKAQNVQARAMHFDLFGGGQDKNAFVQKRGDNDAVEEAQIVEDVGKLTVLDNDRDSTIPTQIQQEPYSQPSTSATDQDEIVQQNLSRSRQSATEKEPVRKSKTAAQKQPSLPQRKLRPRGRRKVITRKKMAVSLTLHFNFQG